MGDPGVCAGGGRHGRTARGPRWGGRLGTLVCVRGGGDGHSITPRWGGGGDRCGRITHPAPLHCPASSAPSAPPQQPPCIASAPLPCLMQALSDPSPISPLHTCIPSRPGPACFTCRPSSSARRPPSAPGLSCATSTCPHSTRGGLCRWVGPGGRGASTCPHSTNGGLCRWIGSGGRGASTCACHDAVLGSSVTCSSRPPPWAGSLMTGREPQAHRFL